MVVGMDPLATATFSCLFLPVEKEPHHLSAIANPSNHKLALRLIDEFKWKAGVPPLPRWLARELANKAPAASDQPEDCQTSTAKGCAGKASMATVLTQGKTEKVSVGDHRPRDHQTQMATNCSGPAETHKRRQAHGDFVEWHATECAPTKKDALLLQWHLSESVPGPQEGLLQLCCRQSAKQDE